MRKFVRYAFCALTALTLALPGNQHASGSNGIFTIYLVRHAEKDRHSPDPENPGLSPCGELRAQALATMLGEIDLGKIYSTAYLRTLDTVDPVAKSQQLEIEEYDPRNLEEFAALLRNGKQDALVVGHSNTTGTLAGLIAGTRGEDMDEDDYDPIYQVVVSADQSRVYLMHQSFDCPL